MTLTQLQIVAKNQGLVRFKRLKKAQLVQILSNEPCTYTRKGNVCKLSPRRVKPPHPTSTKSTTTKPATLKKQRQEQKQAPIPTRVKAILAEEDANPWQRLDDVFPNLQKQFAIQSMTWSTSPSPSFSSTKGPLCSAKSDPPYLAIGTVMFDALYHGSATSFESPYLPNREFNSFATLPLWAHHWAKGGTLYEYRIRPEIVKRYGGIPNLLVVCGRFVETSKLINNYMDDQQLRKHIDPLVTFTRSVEEKSAPRALVPATYAAQTCDRLKLNGYLNLDEESQLMLCEAAIPHLLYLHSIWFTKGGRGNEPTRWIRLVDPTRPVYRDKEMLDTYLVLRETRFQKQS